MAADVRYEVREVFRSDDPQARAAALERLAGEYRRLLLARWRETGPAREEEDEGGARHESGDLLPAEQGGRGGGGRRVREHPEPAVHAAAIRRRPRLRGAGVYVDEDYSGADRERPAFNRMLAAAEQGPLRSSWPRPSPALPGTWSWWKNTSTGRSPGGVRFIAVVDQVDTADAAGKKSRQINGLVNEWYLEDLSNNVRSVLTHKRRAGRYIAAFALFGYQKDPADSGHLVIDPAAAAVVRRVFALYLAGSGAARIARLLNQEGCPRRRNTGGGRPPGRRAIPGPAGRCGARPPSTGCSPTAPTRAIWSRAATSG